MATKVYVAIATVSHTGDQVLDDSAFTYQATFASLNDAFADPVYGFRDITITGEIAIFDLFESYTEAADSNCDTSNFIRSATNTVLVRAAPGYEHTGKPGTGILLTWNQDYYADRYHIGNYVTFYGFSVSTGGSGALLNSISGIALRMIYHNGFDLKYGSALSSLSMGSANIEQYTNGNIYNCTIIGQNTEAAGIILPGSGVGTYTVKNTLIIGFTDVFPLSYSGTLVADTNATDSIAIAGANSVFGLIAANEILDQGNYDGHLKAGNSVQIIGLDLVTLGDVTATNWKDIDGQPYTGFPVGMDEPTAFTVPVTITIKDASTLLPVQGVDVYLKADSGGPLAVGTEVMSGITDVNGEAYFDTPFTSIQPILGQGRKGTTAPFYQETKFTGVITGDGYTNIAYIISDEE